MKGGSPSSDLVPGNACDFTNEITPYHGDDESVSAAWGGTRQPQPVAMPFTLETNIGNRRIKLTRRKSLWQKFFNSHFNRDQYEQITDKDEKNTFFGQESRRISQLYRNQSPQNGGGFLQDEFGRNRGTTGDATPILGSTVPPNFIQKVSNWLKGESTIFTPLEKAPINNPTLPLSCANQRCAPNMEDATLAIQNTQLQVPSYVTINNQPVDPPMTTDLFNQSLLDCQSNYQPESRSLPSPP